MRTFLATHWKSIVVLVILVLLAVFLLPSSTARPALAARLQARSDAVALHTAGSLGLDGAARYIQATLASQGYRVRTLSTTVDGRVLRQVEAVRAGTRFGRAPTRSFIFGARYGSLRDDELTATAAMLELARLLHNVRPAAGTEIRFVFFVGRAVPADGPSGSFIAYAGPRGALDRVGEALAFFRDAPDSPAGARAAPAWVRGVTLSRLDDRGGAMLLADIGGLHSPCLPAARDDGAANFTRVARALRQLALSVAALAGAASA